MAFQFVRIGGEGDTWDDLCADWKSQTEALGRVFDEELQLEADVLKPLVLRNALKAGLYALKGDGRYLAVCQINTVNIPGFKEPVMRIRFLTFAPSIDLGDVSIEAYVEVLIEMFFGVVNLCVSEGVMRAQHMHFHLPSPSDRQYFAAVGRNVAEQGTFKSVDSKGAWLYITH